MAVRVSQDPHYSSSNCFEVEMKQKQKKKRSIPVTKIYEKMGRKRKKKTKHSWSQLSHSEMSVRVTVSVPQLRRYQGECKPEPAMLLFALRDAGAGSVT